MTSKKVDWQLVVLVCSLIILMIMGVRQSLGLFLEPISEFMKDGKEFFSFAIGFQAIIWGIVTFGLGILIDKFGPQKILAFGIICFSSGVFLMSNPLNQLTLFSSTTLMGFGLGGAGMGTMVSIAGKFAPPEKRTFATLLVIVDSDDKMCDTFLALQTQHVFVKPIVPQSDEFAGSSRLYVAQES